MSVHKQVHTHTTHHVINHAPVIGTAFAAPILAAAPVEDSPAVEVAADATVEAA